MMSMLLMLVGLLLDTFAQVVGYAPRKARSTVVCAYRLLKALPIVLYIADVQTVSALLLFVDLFLLILYG